MTMTTDVAPSGWGSTLEKEQEMIALAQETQNNRFVKLSNNKREIKAITQSLRSLINNKKARNLDPDYSPSRSQKQNSRRTQQTIKSRRLQAKGKEFSTDMSSDELESNNRLIFTTLQQPTVKIHVNDKRTRRNSNRRTQSNMEEANPQIHPSIPLLAAVLKKTGEEPFEDRIVVPLWPGQIWYTELLNENAQSLMLGWSNEILQSGTSLIQKN
ncbi:MAG: hypothetical protein EZS28_033818 [Streblomastix strix]|uniref:Uncharacterized protein n=1 Tax=Streblomastix strix TaxID=222440 RepID=A0A5J4UIN0_9EUKA|nr:MAG: hypothetical protein EZS28_033818 [Streblomastix strix]